MRRSYRILIFAALLTALGMLFVRQEGSHIYFAPGAQSADRFYRLMGGVGFLLVLSSGLAAICASLFLCRSLQPVRLLINGFCLLIISFVTYKFWTSLGPGFGVDNWTMIMIVPVLAIAICGGITVFVGLTKLLIQAVRQDHF